MKMRWDPADRFWSKTAAAAGGCIQWTAGKRNGYGAFFVEWTSDRRKKTVSAHRWAYENMVGPIPEGMVIDHVCRNKACVNPWHLEVVTPKENTRRGLAPAAINAAKTHCVRGHPFDEANTMRQKGGRRCRICAAQAGRELRARQFAALKARRGDV